MREDSFEMLAKTLQGLEGVLAEEIVKLGGNNVKPAKRSVFFEGDKSLMYKANLRLRTALRILKPIAVFDAAHPDQIYEAVKAVDWKNFMDADQTFMVETVVYSDTFRHSNFVSYRVKDAIADHFREKTGKRPSVQLVNPDLYIHLHIARKHCTLLLDSSGESLHKRGWRIKQTEASLNEVLAAGMLLLAGWKGQCPLTDPMCGSGTLLIEAALIALDIPPGIYRRHFAFEKWKDFDRELFRTLYEEENRKEFRFRIQGNDISARAIKMAAENIKNAGLSKHIDLKVQGVQEITQAPPNGLLVCNPPYGERLDDNKLNELYQSLGERLKHVFAGNTAWILSSRKDLLNCLGLRHSARHFLMNGALNCEYRRYDIFSGKKKDQFTQ